MSFNHAFFFVHPMILTNNNTISVHLYSAIFTLPPFKVISIAYNTVLHFFKSSEYLWNALSDPALSSFSSFCFTFWTVLKIYGTQYHNNQTKQKNFNIWPNSTWFFHLASPGSFHWGNWVLVLVPQLYTHGLPVGVISNFIWYFLEISLWCNFYWKLLLLVSCSRHQWK